MLLLLPRDEVLSSAYLKQRHYPYTRLFLIKAARLSLVLRKLLITRHEMYLPQNPASQSLYSAVHLEISAEGS